MNVVNYVWLWAVARFSHHWTILKGRLEGVPLNYCSLAVKQIGSFTIRILLILYTFSLPAREFTKSWISPLVYAINTGCNVKMLLFKIHLRKVASLRANIDSHLSNTGVACEANKSSGLVFWKISFDFVGMGNIILNKVSGICFSIQGSHCFFATCIRLCWGLWSLIKTYCLI